jgi:hypothetical protein
MERLTIVLDGPELKFVDESVPPLEPEPKSPPFDAPVVVADALSAFVVDAVLPPFPTALEADLLVVSTLCDPPEATATVWAEPN